MSHVNMQEGMLTIANSKVFCTHCGSLRLDTLVEKSIPVIMLSKSTPKIQQKSVRSVGVQTEHDWDDADIPLVPLCDAWSTATSDDETEADKILQSMT